MKRAPVLFAVVILTVATLYWWWPGISGVGTSDRDDVVLVGAGELIRGSDVVARRLREEGFTVGEPREVSDWCGVLDELDRMEVRTAVVVHLPDDLIGDCDADPDLLSAITDRMDRIGDVDLITVSGVAGRDEGEMNRTLVASGGRLVDASSMIPVDGSVAGCEWWDDCLVAPDGTAYVTVRDSNGLTVAGHQRMARMIVAAVQS